MVLVCAAGAADLVINRAVLAAQSKNRLVAGLYKILSKQEALFLLFLLIYQLDYSV